MDIWKYYDITHREHDICNPISSEKLDELIALLRLNREDPVIDIGCGKGEFLIRLALKYGVRGVGVDISPYFLDQARSRYRERAPGADITFLEMNGAAFQTEPSKQFALAACLGASFIFGGYKGTLAALAKMVKPGGWIVSGEPYWRQEPPSAYLERIACERETFGTHFKNVQAGEEAGLHFAYTLVSNENEFDRYDGLQWYATDSYRRTHPADPEVPELVAKVETYKEAYLRWGRDTLGWAMYLFRVPG